MKHPVYDVIRMFGAWAGTFPTYEAADKYRQEHSPNGVVRGRFVFKPGVPVY